MALATPKQKAFLVALMPDIPERLLKRLTIERASDLIDKRLGHTPIKRERGKKINYLQVRACEKYGVSGEVRTTSVSDRPATGVRTRPEAAGQGRTVPTE